MWKQFYLQQFSLAKVNSLSVKNSSISNVYFANKVNCLQYGYVLRTIQLNISHLLYTVKCKYSYIPNSSD